MKKDDNFFESVYEVVRQIPYGRVTSYGAIARVVGSPQASRMVGWALSAAYESVPYIPAHRVVNRNGLLTGKGNFPTPTMMEELLISEGIQIENDRIVNFKEVFWDPNTLV